MHYRIISFLYIIVTCTIVSSCNFSPKYVRDLSLFKEKKEFENALQKKVSTETLVNWWDRLNDPLTSRLVKKLLTQNLTLKEASERVFQARAAASISKASKMPNITLDNSASRRFTTVTSLPDGAKKKVYTNSYATDLGVSWQLDLFGKLRSANDAAKANALAAEYDLQGITQTLIAELVYRRVSVYLNNKLLQLALENTKNAKKLYITTKKRYELGSSSIKLADLYLVKENYESSKKDIYQYRRLVADEMYKLDILLAQIPGTITKASLARRINLPKSINVTALPMQLLDRRPDLKSAEIKIVAANANIGVAIADLFPNFFINSGINYDSNKLGNLFNSENMSGSILGKITTKIFTGGALRSNIKIQESKARELSLNYSNKILSAIGEVESNLKAEQGNMHEYKAQKGSLKLFELTRQQSDIRYLRGIGTLAKLLENKRKTYNANKLLIASERALWKSRLDLYLSLGGDWLDKDKN